MAIIRQLINRKVLKILDVLLNNKKKFYHLSKISEESRVPIASTFRITNQLVSLNIVEVYVISKMKIYRIADNKTTKELEYALKND